LFWVERKAPQAAEKSRALFFAVNAKSRLLKIPASFKRERKAFEAAEKPLPLFLGGSAGL
jgi:hypothetical protein